MRRQRMYGYLANPALDSAATSMNAAPLLNSVVAALAEVRQEAILFRMAVDVIAGVMGLGDGVVPGPFQFVGSIRIVKRIRVVVSAFEHLPIVETLAALAWDK